MQATATRTWREKIEQEHRELNEMVAQMRAFLREPRPTIGSTGSHVWASDLSKRLVELHDQLCRHFRYEEKGGMMEDLKESHPRATGQVDGLVDEHTAMLAESRELISLLLAYSEDSEEADVRVRKRLNGLLDSLGEHERHESSLIMDLAFDDLGLGD